MDVEQELKNLAVVMAFSGWNDAASSASDSLLYLLDHYDSEEIASLDDERFYDFQATRPHVRRGPDGSWIQWPRTTAHLVRHPQRDIVVIVGPEPNMMWRTFTTEVLDLVGSFEPSLVVLMGALLTDTPHSRPLPVSLTSEDPQLQAEFALEASTYEGPTGILGILHSALQSAGRRTASVWVSIPHYVATPPNPKGQVSLLSQLERLLGITIECPDLRDEADKWTAAVDELSAEDPDVVEYIEALEEAKDTADVEGATGDAIAEEFERYLKGRGDE